MRLPILAAILLVFGTYSAFAQQPAAPAPALAPAPGEVVILLAPIRGIGDDGKNAWIAQAVQQNLLNDLTRLQNVRPVLPANPVTDLESAIKAAKSANATHLFEGFYQLADPGIRITGQILDLRTNQYVGAAKATGPLRELFALEDSVAEQVRRVVITQVRIMAPPPPPQPAADDIAIKADGPVQIQIRRQFPWERDKPFLADARRQALLDREYEDSLYRTTYTYPSNYYGYGYSGYYGGFFHRPWRPHHHRVTFSPGHMIHGRGFGGVIHFGW